MKIDMENFDEDEVEATEADLKGMGRLVIMLAGVVLSVAATLVAFA